MATSGTAAWTPDLTDIVDEAFARCGAEPRNGWDFKTARTSLNLLFSEFANKGLNLWTFESGTLPLVAGTPTYNLPVDTVDIIEHSLRTGTGESQVDLTMTRISVSQYNHIPNKTTQGRPLQVFVERLITPRVTVWPVPDTVQPYSLVYWRMRRVQDAGDGGNTQDIPYRFLDAIIAGLAYKLSMKLPGAFDRVPLLKAQYDESFTLAAEEDRDRASVSFTPRIYSK
jgi:hypothetical protein